MKFILNEKFILDECVKPLLKERFILNESAESEEAFKVLGDFIKKVSSIDTWFENLQISTVKKEDQEIANELKEKGENLLQSITNELTPEVEKELNNYISMLKTQVTPKAEDDENWNDAFNTLDITEWNNSNVAKLKTSLNKIAPLIPKVLGTLGVNSKFEDQRAALQTLKKEAEKATKSIIPLKDKFNQAKDLESIKDSVLTVFTMEIKELLPLFDAQLNEIAKIKEQVVTEKNAETFIKCATEINKLWVKATKTVNDLQNGAKQDTSLEDNDWETEYTNAQNKDLVWQAYLKDLCSNKGWDINRLKQIEKAFRIECEERGFDENGNPFIQFIENYYIKTDMPTTTYNAIHNGAAKSLLSVADIRGEGQVRGCNLIFCKHLWKQSGDIILKYIKKQNDLSQKSISPKAQEKGINSIEELVATILYKNYTSESSSQSLELKTLAEVKKAELELTNSVAGEDEVVLDNKAFISNYANNADELAKIAAALVLGYRLTKPKLDKIEKAITSLNKTSVTSIEAGLKEINNILKNAKTPLNALTTAQAKTLLATITNELKLNQEQAASGETN